MGKRCALGQAADRLTIRQHRSLAHRPARRDELRAGTVIHLGPIAQDESEFDNSQTAVSERWSSFPTCATARHVGYEQIYSSSDVLGDMMFWVKVLERFKGIVQSPKLSIVIIYSRSFQTCLLLFLMWNKHRFGVIRG